MTTYATKLFYNGKEPLSLPRPYNKLLKAGVVGYLRDDMTTVIALFGGQAKVPAELVLENIDVTKVPTGGFDALDDFDDWRSATVKTTDATATTLWEKTLSDDTTYSLRATVGAKVIGGSGRGRFVRATSVYRESAGAATQEGGFPLTPEVDVNSATLGGVDFVVTGNKVQLVVTGKVSTNVRWNATVEIVEATAV